MNEPRTKPRNELKAGLIFVVMRGVELAFRRGHPDYHVRKNVAK